MFLREPSCRSNQIDGPSQRSILMNLSNDQQFFVGWGTLAMINAGLAQGKNRSGLGWFVGSVGVRWPGSCEGGTAACATS